MDDLLRLAADPAAWAALGDADRHGGGARDRQPDLHLDPDQQAAARSSATTARRIGIGLALVLRLGLLGTIAFIVQLTQPLFTAFGHGFSWRDLILIGGGLFLVWKATKEIHHNVDPDHGPDMFDRQAAGLTFGAAIGQILMLDLVFSLDSIITAVGMTDAHPHHGHRRRGRGHGHAGRRDPLARFIQRNPTVVMLALGFLLMIGMTLIAEGFGAHVPKGYIYAAMAFSAAIEGLNMLSRRAKRKAL